MWSFSRGIYFGNGHPLPSLHHHDAVFEYEKRVEHIYFELRYPASLTLRSSRAKIYCSTSLNRRVEFKCCVFFPSLPCIVRKTPRTARKHVLIDQHSPLPASRTVYPEVLFEVELYFWKNISIVVVEMEFNWINSFISSKARIFFLSSNSNLSIARGGVIWHPTEIFN